MKSFYAIKRNQLHTYDKDGKRLFVTRLAVSQLPVVQVKTIDKDGYNAVQVALGSKKRASKAVKGHLKDIAVPRYLREIRLDEATEVKVGDKIDINTVLTVGDVVKVTAVSKGKGFAGGMKRHGFHGGPRTHGQSDRERAPGSIGQGTSPGRIWKGKRMAGHMGNETISITGVQVVYLNENNGELWITGSIPGGKDSLVEISKLREGKFVGLLEKEEPKQEVTVEQAPAAEEVVENETETQETQETAEAEQQAEPEAKAVEDKKEE